MSLTVTQQPFAMARGEDDGIRIGLTTITFDSSYPTGGEAIAASDIDSGLHNILGLIPVDFNAAASLFEFRYIKATGKIMVTVADVQDANATDLSGLVVVFLYICN